MIGTICDHTCANFSFIESQTVYYIRVETRDAKLVDLLEMYQFKFEKPSNCIVVGEPNIRAALMPRELHGTGPSRSYTIPLRGLIDLRIIETLAGVNAVAELLTDGKIYFIRIHTMDKRFPALLDQYCISHDFPAIPLHSADHIHVEFTMARMDVYRRAFERDISEVLIGDAIRKISVLYGISIPLYTFDNESEDIFYEAIHYHIEYSILDFQSDTIWLQALSEAAKNHRGIAYVVEQLTNRIAARIVAIESNDDSNNDSNNNSNNNSNDVKMADSSSSESPISESPISESMDSYEMSDSSDDSYG